MRLLDVVKFSLKALRSRKRRTYLTLLGIFLGVLTLTAVTSYAAGYGAVIQKIIKGGSLKVIYLVPRETSFSDSDLAKISVMDGVETVMPMIRIFGEFNLMGQNVKVSIVGFDVNYVEELFPDLELQFGDWPVDQAEQAIILGSNLINQIPVSDFRDLVGLNIRISLGRGPLSQGSSVRGTIYGIIAPYGTSLMTDVDNSVLVPLDYAIRMYQSFYSRRDYPTLVIVVDDVSSIDRVINELRDEYGDTAYPIAMRDLQRALDTIINTSVLALGSIAAMTIVVASVGIMNAMYTTVTERTKIIGVMRAMGASQREIMISFLFEGIIMSTIAVVLGIVAGYLGAMVLSELISTVMSGGVSIGAGGRGRVAAQSQGINLSVKPVLSLEYALTIAGITLLITLLGALPPARQAAKLEPAKALRFE
ncbi:MAG: ABC transporter permease [Candidatus Korarchaeum sp.]|nr:ABC transporter permease [Candidatus Korarchaeum sp.]MDW8035983.1 FtsX-like permease family protein [Candidatus Korarchaeum sp.]